MFKFGANLGVPSNSRLRYRDSDCSAGEIASLSTPSPESSPTIRVLSVKEDDHLFNGLSSVSAGRQ